MNIISKEQEHGMREERATFFDDLINDVLEILGGGGKEQVQIPRFHGPA